METRQPVEPFVQFANWFSVCHVAEATVCTLTGTKKRLCVKDYEGCQSNVLFSFLSARYPSPSWAQPTWPLKRVGCKNRRRHHTHDGHRVAMGEKRSKASAYSMTNSMKWTESYYPIRAFLRVLKGGSLLLARAAKLRICCWFDISKTISGLMTAYASKQRAGIAYPFKGSRLINLRKISPC